MNKKLTKIYLPKFLQPNFTKSLIRIGKDHDGGYLVPKEDIEKSDVLISLGISFDWSFEKKFKSINKNISIYSYDGSVGFKYFIKNIKYRFKNFLLKPSKYSFLKILSRLRMFLDFCIFFRINLFKNIIFHYEWFVSKVDDENYFNDFYTNYGYEPKSVSTNSIIEKLKPDTYFSIDIEGSEYNILNLLIKNQNNISGVVIEIHDLHKNIEIVEDFIKRFNLKLVHLHINNYSPVINEIPSVVELTFSKYAILEKRKVKSLPNNLDQDNLKHGPQFYVGFLK